MAETFEYQVAAADRRPIDEDVHAPGPRDDSVAEADDDDDDDEFDDEDDEDDDEDDEEDKEEPDAPDAP
jgi:hypothetical protein